MVHILIYLVLSYLVVTYVALEIRHRVVRWRESDRRRGLQRREYNRVANLWTLALLCIPLIPYLVVEIQTIAFERSLYSGVKGAIIEVDGNWHPMMLKVLRITPSRASVYVVNILPDRKQRRRAWVVDLRKEQNRWVSSTSEPTCVWSEAGNGGQNGNVFPPYPSPFQL